MRAFARNPDTVSALSNVQTPGTPPGCKTVGFRAQPPATFGEPLRGSPDCDPAPAKLLDSNCGFTVALPPQPGDAYFVSFGFVFRACLARPIATLIGLLRGRKGIAGLVRRPISLRSATSPLSSG